ncbi:septum site-determining protein MinC [Synergistes jonesii]|uniref:septum site-determining protein MinC n=1 Tax=Synergistes jonesii TaxID=2754 RepID=UPI00248E1D58|nr:septum site-determining protein MinC [Synergistes jonesii]
MIQLKGRQAGSLRCIIPADMSEREMLEGFETLLSTGGRLLKGNNVEIDLQTRAFKPELLLKIWKNFIEPAGCTVSRWIAADGGARELFVRMGFCASADGGFPLKNGYRDEREAEEKSFPGFVYFGTLRGGQSIGHNGDIVVIGNVNQGAEIAAKGNVTIIGRLNGLVHAGCGGDDGVAVVARSLETGQVRIGTKLGIIDRNSPFWGRAVTLKINDNEVQVAPWPEL